MLIKLKSFFSTLELYKKESNVIKVIKPGVSYFGNLCLLGGMAFRGRQFVSNALRRAKSHWICQVYLCRANTLLHWNEVGDIQRWKYDKFHVDDIGGLVGWTNYEKETRR